MGLDETTYNQLVAAAFKRLVEAADEVDPDVLEADSTADMVTFTARSGEKVIVNTQRAVRQIWVAGQGRGIHFSYDPATGRWLDDKGEGLELFGWIASCLQATSGAELSL